MAYFRCTVHPRAAITGPNSEARSSDVSEFQGDDWMEMFTSDHLSHTNYCVWQSGNYLKSNSKSHAIKFVITVAFNYGRQEPECRKFTEKEKWVSVSILILNQVISLGKLLILEKTLLKYPAKYKKIINAFSPAYKGTENKPRLSLFSSTESQKTEAIKSLTLLRGTEKNGTKRIRMT